MNPPPPPPPGPPPPGAGGQLNPNPNFSVGFHYPLPIHQYPVYSHNMPAIIGTHQQVTNAWGGSSPALLSQYQHQQGGYQYAYPPQHQQQQIQQQYHNPYQYQQVHSASHPAQRPHTSVVLGSEPSALVGNTKTPSQTPRPDDRCATGIGRKKSSQRQESHAQPFPSSAPATTEKDAGTGTLSSATGTFRCEPCDKELLTADSFDAHVATHEQCSHVNCTFSATKKVISAHFHSVHGEFSGSGFKDIEVEGQSFRVLLGTSPEEVEQWREARRKKYPSVANVQSKIDHNARLSEAGGLPAKGAAQKGKRKLAGGRGDQADGTLEGARGKQSRSAEAGERSRDVTQQADTAQGLSSAGADAPMTTVSAEGVGLADDSPALGSERTLPVKTRVCYNFSKGKCESGDACPFQHVVQQTCKFYMMGRCRNGTRCRNIHDRDAAALVQTGKDEREEHQKKRKNGLFLPKPLAGGQRGTLLRKLLEDSIEEEENIILQAVRYFANRLRSQNTNSLQTVP